jgi:hypothetical protein
MGMGQRLNVLEAILDRLWVKISQSSFDLMAKGSAPKPTDAKYHDFWREVSGYLAQLSVVMRELDSYEHLLDHRARIARSCPRELRFRANQSVRDLGDRRQQVYEKAVRVEAALRDLYFRGQTPTTNDIIKAIEKLSKEIEAAADVKTMIEQLQQHRPQFDVLTQQRPTVQNVPFSFVIMLIVLYIRSRSKPKSTDTD